MRCQCGASIPDNVAYCPYCGKRQFIRTRPAQLTNQPVEPFQGYYADGGKNAGCLSWFFSLSIATALIGFGIWFFWQDGQFQYIIEWFHSLGL